MASETGSKLNRLQKLVPEGLLVDAAWLDAEGYTHPLRQKYVASGWLTMPVRGVYQRPAAGDAQKGRLDWRLVILSMQTLMKMPVTVGGRTALELQGLAHYLPQGRESDLHLYASARLPGWLAKLPLNARLVAHRHARLFNDISGDVHQLKRNVVTKESFSPELPGGEGLMLQLWGHWDWPLTISTPERAALELMDELPDRESFAHVDDLMGGLANLSPRRVQRLLEACHSIKVKRLFLFMADRHNHAWFKRLDMSRIDLGSGKRSLVEGGRYDPKYRITVPETLVSSADDV